jgi:hypothetical protein
MQQQGMVHQLLPSVLKLGMLRCIREVEASAAICRNEARVGTISCLEISSHYVDISFNGFLQSRLAREVPFTIGIQSF